MWAEIHRLQDEAISGGDNSEEYAPNDNNDDGELAKGDNEAEGGENNEELGAYDEIILESEDELCWRIIKRGIKIVHKM